MNHATHTTQQKKKLFHGTSYMLHDKRGMTLIEVIVAMFMIAVLLVLYVAALNTVALTKKLRYENFAYHVANIKMEELRNTIYENLPSSGSITDSMLSQIPQGVGSFTVGNYPSYNNLKEITVLVTWNDGIAKQVQLKTLAGKGGINPFNKTTFYMEAENSTLVSPMSITNDATASGGMYVTSQVRDTGSATFNFSVPTAGAYYVWGRVYSPSYFQDSYYVSLDGGSEDIYDTAEGTWGSFWQWTKVNGRNGTGVPLTLNPRTFSLSVGAHALRFREREPNTILDKIYITDDPNKQPQ